MSPVSMVVKVAMTVGCLYLCSSVPSKKAAVAGPLAAPRLGPAPAASAEACAPSSAR
jgi:hypothetical protein